FGVFSNATDSKARASGQRSRVRGGSRVRFGSYRAREPAVRRKQDAQTAFPACMFEVQREEIASPRGCVRLCRCIAGGIANTEKAECLPGDFTVGSLRQTP